MPRMLMTVAFAAFLMPLAAASSFADERDTATASVNLRGINVGSAAGSALLHTRLVAAARLACGTAETSDLQGMADMKACRAAATAQAAPQLEAAIASARLAARDSLVAANTLR